MGRRHSDAASFEVIGLVSYGKTSNASTSSQVVRIDAEDRALLRLSSKADKAFLSAVGHGPDIPANFS